MFHLQFQASHSILVVFFFPFCSRCIFIAFFCLYRPSFYYSVLLFCSVQACGYYNKITSHKQNKNRVVTNKAITTKGETVQPKPNQTRMEQRITQNKNDKFNSSQLVLNRERIYIMNTEQNVETRTKSVEQNKHNNHRSVLVLFSYGSVFNTLFRLCNLLLLLFCTHATCNAPHTLELFSLICCVYTVIVPVPPCSCSVITV